MVGTAESRGHTISYEVAGAGPPIVLVPGTTMLAADWRGVGYTARLAQTHRVIAIDPLLSEDEPPEDRANGVRRTADALDVPLHVLDGLNHEAGFAAVDVVLPLVLDFLDRVRL